MHENEHKILTFLHASTSALGRGTAATADVRSACGIAPDMVTFLLDSMALRGWVGLSPGDRPTTAHITIAGAVALKAAGSKRDAGPFGPTY